MRYSREEDTVKPRLRFSKGARFHPSRFWVSLLFALPLWLGATIGLNSNNWWWISDFPLFGDLGWVARWSTCIREVPFLDAISECKVGYPLPFSWVGAVLGFSESSVTLVGTILTLLWVFFATLMIVGVARAQGLLWGALIALTLSAPPTWLMLQRGNLDQITWIFCLIALWATLNRYNKTVIVFLSGAILLKFFPIGMVSGFTPYLKSERKRFFLYVAFPIAFATIIYLSQAKQMEGGRLNAVESSFSAFQQAYYLRILFSWLQESQVSVSVITLRLSPSEIDYIFGALLFVISVALVWALFVRRLQVPVAPAQYQWFFASLGLFLGAYLMFSNFDYRMTFVAFIVTGLGLLFRKANSHATKRVMLFAALGLSASCWMSVGMPIAVQALGDLVLWLSLVVVTALAIQLFIAQWSSQPEPIDSDTTGAHGI